MVDFIKRDNGDIYSKPILGFLFKNQKFLLTLKIVVLSLFVYALYFGFAHTGKDNMFTKAVFWGIFWSLFMVITLPTFGRIFCGICPHGFMGKYITKFGLKKTMPKWMQNRYIGLFLIVIGWWGIYYIFPGVYRTPLGTAVMFTVITLFSFIIYFLYKDMSYCKYICPIGTLTRAYSKLSFTWLGTYKSACNECKTFECATACPYHLKPFTFDKRNSMNDCTLCMDCSNACEAISFKYKKPSSSLSSNFKIVKAEIWAYVLILASIPIAMAFHHGIGRSNAAGDMIWSKTAEVLKGYISFGSIDPIGLFAFLYAVIFTVLAAVIGMFVASKILKKDFNSTFYDLGYSYAPLFILGSIAHSLETFFMRGYKQIIEGFAQGFGLTVEVASLAKRGDSWLQMFGLLKWIAIVWALIILYKRMKNLNVTKMRKIFAYPFAASLIIFFLSVNTYRGYILDTYGRAVGGHGNHGGGAMFQTVPKDKAILLQDGKNKSSCIVCGMKLPMFYKTSHASKLGDKDRQYCSLHCLAEEKNIKKMGIKDFRVVDVTSLKFIDAKKAFYVVGSKKKATMSEISKYAFADKKDAVIFSKKFKGTVVNFDEALKIAMKDFSKNKITKRVKPWDTIYFTDKKPVEKKNKRGSGGHMMHGGNRGEIPSRKMWLVTDDINNPKCVENVRGIFYTTDINNNIIKPKVTKRGCENISFKMPVSGYYTAYYTQDINNYITVAKYEFKRFDHSNESVYDKETMSAKTIKEVPFDILRLRNDDETFYSRPHSGEEIRFKILKDGKPLKGVSVILQTQFGWQKNVITNDKGIAKFQLIKDYNPKWDKYNKRFREIFIVTAQYKDENKKYKATYTGVYSPARSEYQSYGYGLIIAIVIFIILSGAVFLYRARVQKPFHEVTFNE